jgi:hypothetical protein
MDVAKAVLTRFESLAAALPPQHEILYESSSLALRQPAAMRLPYLDLAKALCATEVMLFSALRTCVAITIVQKWFHSARKPPWLLFDEWSSAVSAA